jgi:carboxynorspermidine decarboxylase
MITDIDTIRALDVDTPAFVFDLDQIDEDVRIAREALGGHAKLYFAMKACAFRGAIDRMADLTDGLHASSLFEARLAAELRGARRIHLTTPGLREDEFEELVDVCDRISFNSLEQWRRFARGLDLPVHPGLRINPRLSFVNDERYDPCRRHSKLGVPIDRLADEELPGLDGILVHTNADSEDLGELCQTIEHLAATIPQLLHRIRWVNLGGGYLFRRGQDFEPLHAALERMGRTFDVEIFVEPGASLIRRSGYIVSTVIDRFEREGKEVAILDTAVSHVPEIFEYQYHHEVAGAADARPHSYLLGGTTCLAGDLFGEYAFAEPLEVGSRVVFTKAGAYSLVKASMFNGVNLPTSTRSIRGRSSASDGSIFPIFSHVMEARLQLSEFELDIPAKDGHRGLIRHFAEQVADRVGPDNVPVRFVVDSTTDDAYHCELGVLEELPETRAAQIPSIFDFRRRTHENTSNFNVVLMIPTGIGCELGGHAGDANALAQLVGSACDTLITHPNVVNASDINELPPNALYVEGSVVSRLLMGTVGLRRVRRNRVLTIMDAHPDPSFEHTVVNSVSSARASYGFESAGVVAVEPPLRLDSTYAESGRAVGVVRYLERLLDVLDERRGTYDAVALTTMIHMPDAYRDDYYAAAGEAINPWGGVEAMLTHTTSMIYDLPSAHAPMDESKEVAHLELGTIDPRMAAEAISVGYFMCALKGLQRSPALVESDGDFPADVLSARDVSCIVMPDKCVGLPTLAAIEQGIAVIAVRENDNIMENDLTAYPWAPGQLHIVENYWEAIGVMQALRTGISPASVRRPLAATEWDHWRAN